MTLLTAIGFPLIALLFFGLLFKEIKKAIMATPWTDEKKKKVYRLLLMSIIVWAMVVAVGSLSGFAGRFELFPFNIMPFVLIPLLTVIILLFQTDTNSIIEQINLKAITQLQVFRVFVEIILWLMFIQHLLPVQMTFEGSNYDILAGITSLLAARFLFPSRNWMIAWNIAGLGLLINIVSIAILSMPTSLRLFDNEPANTIVTQFPYIILPTFLVPLAYILHFISLKKLLRKS